MALKAQPGEWCPFFECTPTGFRFAISNDATRTPNDLSASSCSPSACPGSQRDLMRLTVTVGRPPAASDQSETVDYALDISPSRSMQGGFFERQTPARPPAAMHRPCDHARVAAELPGAKGRGATRRQGRGAIRR